MNWCIGAFPGDSTVRYFEVAAGALHLLGSAAGPEQVKGACLLPKAALRLFDCEVDCLLRLTERGVIPLGIEVPRSDKTK